MAELYTRLEILKSKQIEGVKTTRYTTDTIRACQGRIRTLLQEVGGIEEIQTNCPPCSRYSKASDEKSALRFCRNQP